MKKTIRIVLFLALTFLTIYGVYRVLSWKDTAGENVSSVISLNALEKNTVDVTFVGSSHVFCGVAPNVLWDKFGIAAFDMTVSGMDKDSAYYYTKELLKSQSPKVVCVDLFPLTFDKHAVLGNEYRNMLSMNWGQNSVDLINEYADASDKMDYILRWPIIHTRYKEITRHDFQKYGLSKYNLGENLQNAVGFADIFTPRSYTEIGELSEENKEWIDRFIDLAKEKDFELIFFLTPYSVNEWEMGIFNAAEEYINANGGARYENGILEENMGLNSQTDFCDWGHLNEIGAQKNTEWLARVICRNVEFQSHDGDKRYSPWDENSLYYQVKYTNDAIRKYLDSNDFTNAILLMQKTNYMEYVVVIDDNWREYRPDFEEVLLKVNIDIGKNSGSGVFICKGNDVINGSEQSENGSFYKEISKYKGVKTILDSDNNIVSVLMGEKECKENLNVIGISMYDTFNDEFFESWTWH